MNSSETQNWLADKRYQTILKSTRTIAYEYNLRTGKQIVSPYIGQYIAGNYDGRLLSQVMLEDHVIHPDDLQLSLTYRQQIQDGTATNIVLRLRTPDGPYHWFRMNMCPHSDGNDLCYLGTITDIDSEIRHQEALRYHSEYDLATGIYNKATFYSATGIWMNSKPELYRCLISFDIDRFKIINETCSLSEGDNVLRYVAGLLRELTNPGETYARNNSDIFFVCLARPKEEAVQFVMELERRLNQYPLDFQFILSAGIVTIPTYNGEPVNILCDRAAMAQHTVKGSYINNHAFYDSSMSDALNKENYITKNMNLALQEKQFQIYLQPKYDMRNRTIVGAEALSRWIHPTDGMISPGEFIPLFERNGFILRLDEYVWDLACQTIRRWMDEGHQIVPISVNVSRMHLYDSDLCDKLISLVKKYDIPPHTLELEITESAYINNPNTLYDIMDKLQEAGFIFSMDDFGSGYSSLNALKDIPVDVVKIDLNFLRKSRRDAKIGLDILRGTIRMIHDIHLPVIAEGVETKDQAEFLLDVGCIHAQGYYYARPMPIPEFEKLLCS